MRRSMDSPRVSSLDHVDANHLSDEGCAEIEEQANRLLDNIEETEQAHYDRKIKEDLWIFPKEDISFWLVSVGEYGYQDGTPIRGVDDWRVYGEE